MRTNEPLNKISKMKATSENFQIGLDYTILKTVIKSFEQNHLHGIHSKPLLKV